MGDAFFDLDAASFLLTELQEKGLTGAGEEPAEESKRQSLSMEEAGSLSSQASSTTSLPISSFSPEKVMLMLKGQVNAGRIDCSARRLGGPSILCMRAHRNCSHRRAYAEQRIGTCCSTAQYDAWTAATGVSIHLHSATCVLLGTQSALSAPEASHTTKLTRLLLRSVQAQAQAFAQGLSRESPMLTVRPGGTGGGSSLNRSSLRQQLSASPPAAHSQPAVSKPPKASAAVAIGDRGRERQQAQSHSRVAWPAGGSPPARQQPDKGMEERCQHGSSSAALQRLQSSDEGSPCSYTMMQVPPCLPGRLSLTAHSAIFDRVQLHHCPHLTEWPNLGHRDCSKECGCATITAACSCA